MDGTGVASGAVMLPPVGPYTSTDGNTGGSGSIWGRVITAAKVVTPFIAGIALGVATWASIGIAWVVTGAAVTLYMVCREYSQPSAIAATPLLPLQNKTDLYLAMHSVNASFSNSGSGAQGASGGASLAGRNGNKMYTLQGSGRLTSCSGVLSSQERKFIQNGIDRGKISIARDVPEGDDENVLMMPLKDFQHGQIITYKSGGISRYFSVDTIRGEYNSTGCFRCPINQGLILGIRQGDQPPGTMNDRVNSTIFIPGYGQGAIVINYAFPNGVYPPSHARAGQPYTGTHRTCYLPNNSEGQKVLVLLKQAFNQKLTFTIGTSNTTGASNVVTWNDIHHKTSITGGPQNFGYPDPTYLSRVKGELKAKGIQ